MPFRFKQGEDPAKAVRRLVCEQADRALDALREPEGRADAAHEARKRFKKIRAVLRLARDAMGEEAFDRENAAWRDAGRILAPIREVNAQIELTDALRPHAEGAALAALDHARETLQRRAAAAGDAGWTREEIFDRAIQAVWAARGRAPNLPLPKGGGFKPYRKGLKRVYRRGGLRGARAWTTAAPEDFHDWRKRVKYLWLQLRLLAPAAPDEIGAMADRAKALADILGEDHDLAELQALLDAQPDLAGPEGAEPLARLARARSGGLRDQARPLYEALYAERPGAFGKRIQKAWEAWDEAGEGADDAGDEEE